jgi:hypothetical protein
LVNDFPLFLAFLNLELLLYDQQFQIKETSGIRHITGDSFKETEPRQMQVTAHFVA